MNEEKPKTARTIFSSKWFSVEAQDGADCGIEGADQPFYKINYVDGVVILPITEDGRFVLIRQYRPALRRVTIEIPAGAVDEGEAPETAAVRELYEETGYRCTNLKAVGRGILRLDREDALNHYFVATGAVVDPTFRPTERISVFTATPDEFKALVVAGRFDHIAALPLFVMGAWSFGMDCGVTMSREAGS